MPLTSHNCPCQTCCDLLYGINTIDKHEFRKIIGILVNNRIHQRFRNIIGRELRVLLQPTRQPLNALAHHRTDIGIVVPPCFNPPELSSGMYALKFALIRPGMAFATFAIYYIEAPMSRV